MLCLQWLTITWELKLYVQESFKNLIRNYFWVNFKNQIWLPANMRYYRCCKGKERYIAMNIGYSQAKQVWGAAKVINGDECNNSRFCIHRKMYDAWESSVSLHTTVYVLDSVHCSKVKEAESTAYHSNVGRGDIHACEITSFCTSLLWALDCSSWESNKGAQEWYITPKY